MNLFNYIRILNKIFNNLTIHSNHKFFKDQNKIQWIKYIKIKPKTQFTQSITQLPIQQSNNIIKSLIVLLTNKNHLDNIITGASHMFSLITNRGKQATSNSGSTLKQQIIQYHSLKQTIVLPLKLKLYFSMLQNLVDTKSCIKIPKQFRQNYKTFLKSFQKISIEQKYSDLVNMLKSVFEILNKIQPEQLTQLIYQRKIQEIQSTCYVLQHFMGLSKKVKRGFKFNSDQKKVKISQNKKQISFDLQNYNIRKSIKDKNTFILQAIFELHQIPQILQKYYISFKDTILFEQIFKIVKQCVLSIWKQRFKKMLNEDFKVQEIHSSPIKNTQQVKLNLLTNKNITEYFKFKQKMEAFLIKNYQKLTNLNTIRNVKIFTSNKIQNFYLTQKILNEPFQKVLSRIQLLSKQPQKRLFHFQKLQKFANNISAVYFKYLVKGKDYQILCISQDSVSQNNYTVIYKAIDNFISKKSIEFLEIKIDKIQSEQTKIRVYGTFKFDSMNRIGPVGVYDFLMGIVQSEQTSKSFSNSFNVSVKKSPKELDQMENQQQNDQQFHTVVGQFQEDQERERQFIDSQIKKSELLQEQQKQYQTSKQIKNQANLQTFYIKKSCQENQQIQVAKENTNFQNINKKQSYLRRHFQTRPVEINLQKELLTKHYYTGCWAKYSKGGLYSLDFQALNNQKKLFKIVLARMGSNLFKHKSIMNMSLPVIIFKPESNLQTIARNLTFTPLLFLNQKLMNPLQKMKKTILFMISMGTIGISLQKPFNPIIGQTLQGFIAGCPISLEQISHHPPISSLYFQGKDFIIYGNVAPKVGMGLNNVKGYSQQPIKVKFNQDQVIEFTLGKMQIGGFLFGDRTFNFQGTNYFTDDKNKIIGELFFGPRKKFTKNFDCQTLDFVSGYIYSVSDSFMVKYKKEGQNISPKNDKSTVILSTIYGCWYEKIFMDDKEVFDFTTVLPYKFIRQTVPLPSDSTLRDDIKFLQKGDLQKAQEGKDSAEQKQREDQKLRQKYKTK